MNETAVIREALNAHEGVIRLAPTWVPRSFVVPGGRLRLDPRDLYALGAHRGGIDERWLASTIPADNGPGTPEDEGLSYISHEGERVLLRTAVEAMGDQLLGSDVMRREGGWTVLAKLFDNFGPLPHHMHQQEEHAQAVGRHSKPEAYFFPREYDSKENAFPYTFMGLNPGVCKSQVRHCLEHWNDGDNGILLYSRAYKLEPGTGWQIDAGILHAPGSLVTYEVQRGSDVLAMFQSMLDGRPVSWDLLVKDVPPERRNDLDYIVGMLDWDANVDPDFVVHRQCRPKAVRAESDMAEHGYCERWIAYSKYYCAKELTVFPGRSVVIGDAAAYGLLVIQGHGAVGGLPVEAPSLIRYGQMTQDELFVTVTAAKQGVVIRNLGETENLVILKHFGPDNPDTMEPTPVNLLSCEGSR